MSIINRQSSTFKAIFPISQVRKARHPRPITRPRPRPRPARNPRLTWPDWCDSARWETSEAVMHDGELQAWNAVPEGRNPEVLSFHRFTDSTFPKVGKTDQSYQELDCEPRPTFDDSFQPSEDDEAFWSAFTIARSGVWPEVPASLSDRQSFFYGCGRRAGFMESPEGKAWCQELREDLERQNREIHHAEWTEAGRPELVRNSG